MRTQLLFSCVVGALAAWAAAAAEPTVIHDEIRQGDFGAVAPSAAPTLRITEPGVKVITGTGTDGLDDTDQFVFEVAGDKPFDFALLADPAEFKKLRSVGADGTATEVAFGSTNPRFGVPRNISRTELPPGRYHVEMYMGPQGVVGAWTCRIAIRDGGPPPDLAREDPEPTVAEKMKQVRWPGAISIFHGANWGEDLAYLDAIAECGFGAAGCAEYQLPQLQERGMKGFLFIWPHEVTTVPPKHVADDSVLCYYLSDRIPPNQWAAWASQEKLAWRADPHHPAVFTMYALMGGIPQFPELVRGRAMEFYHYHWDANRQPQNHFAVLEQYRQASRANGDVPVVLIAETRAEDVRKTRQTIFTALAYGVRGFRTGGPGLFDTAKRDDRGRPTRTVHGEEALRFNAAIRAYAPVFEKNRCVEVFHTAPLPAGTREAPADHWVRPAGDAVVMGEFAGSGDRYLVLANRDAAAPHEATLSFSAAGARVDRLDVSTGAWQPVASAVDAGRATVKVPLAEGGGELLRVAGAGS